MHNGTFDGGDSQGPQGSVSRAITPLAWRSGSSGTGFPSHTGSCSRPADRSSRDKLPALHPRSPERSSRRHHRWHGASSHRRGHVPRQYTHHPVRDPPNECGDHHELGVTMGIGSSRYRNAFRGPVQLGNRDFAQRCRHRFSVLDERLNHAIGDLDEIV